MDVKNKNSISTESVSLISTFLNLFLALGKIFIGWWSKSMALMSEGIHSFADVISSFVSFLGIKISKKPESEKHQYGYARYESIAAFLVVLLLFFSSITILWEAIQRLVSKESPAIFTIWGIVIMGLSTIINWLMSKWKFKVASQESSLALATDAEHSRVDAISSVALLVGLYLIKYWPIADSILAIGVASYILFEIYPLTKEVIGSLTDVANPELKEKIEKILKKEHLEYGEIKTRKVGSVNFAEISLLCNPQLKIDEVSAITNSLEKTLLKEIPELKQISILVKSHEVQSSAIKPLWGETIKFFKKREKLVHLPKQGNWRVVIPMANDSEISLSFGSKFYLVIDTDRETHQIIGKTFLRNPYFSEEGGHGIKFIKDIEANEVITKQIGESALTNLKNQSIKVKMIPHDLSLEKALKMLEADED